jgi:ribosome-associated protein
MTDEPKPRLPRDLKRRLGRKEARSADVLADLILKTRPGVFDVLPLTDEARKAFTELRAMRVQKERARQLRYVQRLVRESDRDALEAALEATENDGDDEVAQKRAEHVADAIIERGDTAIDDAIDVSPSLDRTTLRNLLRNVKKASEKDAPRARRALVAHLKAAPVGPAADEDEDDA